MGEEIEEDDFVEAVDEFRAEVLFEFVDETFFLFFFGEGFEIGEVDGSTAEIAGADDDGVFKVDDLSFGIGEPAFIEDLEEEVEDIGVGFFDFIEKYDGIWASAHGFGELAACFIADIAGRSADESGGGVFFHEFAHVETKKRVFGAEEIFGEAFGELGFADAAGTHENK